MPSYTSLTEYDQHLREIAKKDNLVRKSRVVNVGISAESVQGMDGYETWLAHLTSLRDAAKQTADSWRDKLITGMVPQGVSLTDWCAHSQRLYAEANGAYTAYQNAIDLIPTLIKRGQEADASLP